MSNLKQNGKLRWAPSYLRRRGQMTTAQKQAFRDRWPEFGVEFRHGETISIAEEFPDPSNPLVLEIGFGMGENLLHLAKTNPDHNFLGIEVHKPGIGAVLKAMDHRENIRLMRGDARLILEDHIVNPVFQRACIFFPDPWPKSGNEHRRLVQPEFIDVLKSRMTADAEFHFATDVDDYADHIREVMGGASPTSAVADNWCRVPSKYESKGLERGHRIHDLVYPKN